MNLVLAALALTGAVDEWFERANQDYYRGDFAAATAGYERVLALGVPSADLYYNLGSAYLRAGRIGHAIWSYERALSLAPKDEDAAWNLEAARREAQSRWEDRLQGEAADPLWIRAVTWTGRPALTWAFACAYVAFFAALCLRRWASGVPRAGLGAAAALLAVFALAAGGVFGGRVVHDRHVRRGIVLADEVSARDGPEEGARVAFQVHGGHKVRLMEREAGWVRVRLGNGLEGWLRDREVGRL